MLVLNLIKQRIKENKELKIERKILTKLSIWRYVKKIEAQAKMVFLYKKTRVTDNPNNVEINSISG